MCILKNEAVRTTLIPPNKHSTLNIVAFVIGTVNEKNNSQV